MRYERMTLDEYALYQWSTGLKVVEVGGTWWAEVRPFFFRPLIPLTEIEGGRYPFRSFIGGCLHAVSPVMKGNARMNFFIYDDIQNYSLSQLGEKHRYITRKGIRNFEARRLTDLKQFTEEAYPIYVSFYNRTHYEYKKERVDKAHFSEWARKIFDSRGLLVVGAFRHEKLAAIDISCQVGDVIIDEVFFADTESLDLKVTDFLLHTVREAATFSDALYLFRGLPSGREGLDRSKIMRGCKVLQKPAVLRINPAVLCAARLFMKNSYAKLREITSLSSPAGQSMSAP